MNLSCFTFRNKLVHFVFFLMLVSFNSKALAQKNIYKVKDSLNNTQLMNSSLVKKIVDLEINVPNHISIKPKAYLRLKVNSGVAPFNWAKTTLNLTLIPILPSGVEDGSNQYTKTIEVEYNPLGNSISNIDLSSHELENRYGVKVVVNSYSTTDLSTSNVTNTINPNVSLELGFESERYYKLSEQLPTIQSQIINDTDAVPVALQLNWAKLTGALEYELEWTWVDNYSVTSLASILQPSAINFSSRDFELNNTRIKTTEIGYQIPLIYPKGYIIYRVRAIGRFMDDINKNYYGPWSSGIVEKNTIEDWENSYVLINSDHEKQKNWQFQASYAEQGKKKEVVTYFDGSLRNRQTVTKINSNSNAVVGEVIYDTQGRPAIEVLPTPLNKNYIRYFKDLNLNANGQLYSHLDFDWETVVQNCSPQISSMKNTSGSSQYYSGLNNVTSPLKNYIPNAFNYPFSQIEYTPDNTGRIARKGGVGQSHQLGSGHEMRYFYSVPNQEELNRLFGYEVGYASYYKKNTVVDPNGQVSVSYLDPQGRTIATALAGGKPENLSGLPDESNSALHKTITVDLLNKSNLNDVDTLSDNNELGSSYSFSNLNDKLVLSKQIGVAGNNIEHNFIYNVKNANVFTPDTLSCGNKYSFVYDLNISLKDNCANDLLSPTISNVTIGSESIGVSPPAFNVNQTILPEDLSLNTGNYSFVKELRVNKDVLNRYADNYIATITNPSNPSCYINPAVFSSYNSSTTITCETTCEECTNSIGTKSQYILKQLNGIYNVTNNDPVTFVVNSTNYSVTINQPASGSTINFGEPISQTDVDGFVIRLMDEWETLNQACEQLCGPTFTSGCSMNEDVLLADVSPNGQYGLIADLDPDNNPNPNWATLSLFNENNKIIYQGHVNDSINYKFNWRNPLTPYLDEEGNQSRIEVSFDGETYTPEILNTSYLITDAGSTFVLPQNLKNKEDFITNWTGSWAKSLVGYHPEYRYLEYSKALCQLTKQVNVSHYGGVNNETLLSTTARNLTSDDYDEYLDSIDTYSKALSAGYLNISSPYSNSIYSNDPYFSNTIPSVETTSLFNIRKQIMIDALNTKYENYTLNSDGTGGSAKLFQAAVLMVKSNSIQNGSFASINLSNLTNEEKDRIWNTYKTFYLSLKANIKHVFINTYATVLGSYNGCIGEDNALDFTNVIKNYSTRQSSIKTYIQQNLSSNPVFCSVNGVSNYKEKEKRFVPSNFGYDADIDPNEAVAQLVDQSNYQYYQQTGNCPMINDLSIYLNSLFSDINNSSTALTSWTAINQSFTAKLFEQFTGAITPLALNVSSPAVSLQVNANELSFIFAPMQLSGIPLKLNLPANSGLLWSNYGGNTWKIISFDQLYYDASNSIIENTSKPVFAFKVIAKVQLGSDTANIKEIILSGNTFAKIGECHINGTGGSGEVLNPEVSKCNKREQFSDALKDLVLNLQSTGNFNSVGFDITNNTIFNNGYLKTYFGINPGDIVKWNYDGSEAAYDGLRKFNITVNDVKRFVFNTFKSTVTNNYTITDLYVGNNFSLDLWIQKNGSTDLYKTRISSGDENNPLYFACCSPCGEWDFNGDGLGDVCQQIISNPEKIVSCTGLENEEIIFENKLKDILNDFLLIGNHVVVNGDKLTSLENNGYLDVADNLKITDFIDQTCLRQRWDYASKSFDELNFESFVVLDSYKIRLGIDLLIGFINKGASPTDSNYFSGHFYSRINLSDAKVINSVDIVQSYGTNSGIVVYYEDINNISKIQSGSDFFTDLDFKYNNGINSTTMDFCPFLNQYQCSNEDKFLNCLGEKVCIPQTVEPVSCDDKYLEYTSFFNFDTNGNSQKVQGMVKLSKIDFCSTNLQYLISDYSNYINALQITSTNNPNYVTLLEFGDTQLHYGYKNMGTAISAYTSYAASNASNQERLYWREYVNTIYVASMADCPPAVLQTSNFSYPLAENENPAAKNPCDEILANVSASYQLEYYNKLLGTLRQQFINDYIKQAMENVVENCTMTYANKEYQYTLYYYDQAGNLIKTIAPQGVNRLDAADAASVLLLNDKINNIRKGTLAEDSSVLPVHTFKTEYKYNTLNQLVWQKTPDGGITRFAYDVLGRIIASQNEKQKNQNLEPGKQRFSFTNYDYLGRIVQAGEIHVPLTTSCSITDEGRLLVNSAQANEFVGNFEKTEVTKTVYTEDPLVETDVHASSLFTTNDVVGFNPAVNNRNRVTGVFYYDTFNASTPELFNNAILYNYDVHGNVKEVVNYNSYLKQLGCNASLILNNQTDQTNDCEAHLKRVVYDYDLISGNVNRVIFQPNKADQFIHQYNYDADNRIINVQTSTDGVIWEKDASYQYYTHGPLARVELGDKKVQGIDYAYTLQGWLKAVNGENISNSDNDMGNDGVLTGKTKTKDAFGYSLNYYDGDYSAITGDNNTAAFKPLMYSRNNVIPGNSNNLYNGNIKQMTTAIRKSKDELLAVQKNNYNYDQLNRIKAMTSSSISPENGNYTSSYGANYSYDRNGNLLTLTRTAPAANGAIVEMDQLVYDYQAANNKLALVKDNTTTPSTTFTNDLENQVAQLAAVGVNYNITNLASHNYIYDEIGQLIQDKTEGLSIQWRVDGKVKKVTKSKNGNITYISFEYDGLGNRIAKKIVDQNNPSNDATLYYSRDAQGNELAVYKLVDSSKDLYLKEHHIFGSSRLGLEESNILVYKNDGSTNRVSQQMSTGKTLITDTSTADSTSEMQLVQTQSMVTGPVPVVRDYSLFVNSATTASWPIVNSSTVLSKPNEMNIALQTKFKLNDTSIANGTYAIGQLEYKAITSITEGQNYSFPTTGTSCITVSPTGTGEVDLKVNSGSSCNNQTINFGTVINQNQNGFVEYEVPYEGATKSNTVGLTIGGVFYGFKVTMTKSIFGSSHTNKLERIIGSTTTTIYSQSVTNSNRIYLKLSYVDGIILLGYYNTSGTWMSVIGTSGITQLATLKCTFVNNNSYIYNLRVSRDVTTNKEITNQVLVTLNKTASGFQTRLDLAQRTATSPLREFSVVSGYKTGAEYSNGVDLNFNANFKDKVFSYLINNESQQITNSNWVTSSTTYPIINQNKLGGVINSKNALSFDMCYLNYTLSPYEAAVPAQSFSFNDATSNTVTNNAPVSSTGTTMTVSPAVVRALSGLCQTDSDADGIYDMNEDVNQDDDLANDDSDGDGVPNYLDADDDGDGVLTKNEGAAIIRNQFSPYAIVNTSLNTDGDSVSNYLDVDDDGDGVATQYEGTNSLGTGQDTDQDGIYDYLDKDDDGDGVYTMYEGTNSDGDLNPNTGTTLNTDHFTDRNGNRVVDLVPNYLDNDDDGDGVFTKYEGANPDADGNPNTGNTLNTDAVAGNNPNMKVDTIPNYLDFDDDGDGYASWEEGANSDGDGNPGTGATQDADNDGVPDYIDYSDIVYPATQPIVLNNYVNLVGDKRYELANHLGNVLVVVSDKKIPMFNTEDLPSSGLKYFNADVLSYSDYYPFGMLVPNRHGSSDKYRYGFNGMEKDDELKGEGNSYDFGERMLDTRIGRFFTMDKFSSKFPSQSPYLPSKNNPILYLDEDGNYAIEVHYRIAYEAAIKAGFNKEIADKIAYMSSTYADHPEPEILPMTIMGMKINDGKHLKYGRFGVEYGKGLTANSQLDTPKNALWHAMRSTEDVKNGMTAKEAKRNGKKFGWESVLKAGLTGDFKLLGQGVHALQDADAHEGASMEEHLGEGLFGYSMESYYMLVHDVYGSTFEAKYSSETAMNVYGLLTEDKGVISKLTNKNGIIKLNLQSLRGDALGDQADQIISELKSKYKNIKESFGEAFND